VALTTTASPILRSSPFAIAESVKVADRRSQTRSSRRCTPAIAALLDAVIGIYQDIAAEVLSLTK